MIPAPIFLLRKPSISRSAFIAPNATLLGDVTIGEQASVALGAINALREMEGLRRRKLGAGIMTNF